MTIQKLSALTKTASAAVTAFGILAFMLLVGALTATKNADALLAPTTPDAAEEADDLKTRIIAAYDDNIVGFDKFISVYGISQKLLGTSIYEDAGTGYLIRDSADFLHYHTEPADAQPYADAVAVLRDMLADEIEGYTKFPLGIDYASTDNARAMREALRAHGIDLLSFAEIFEENGIDPASQFYRTDHHWTTQTAFEAFTVILPYLNAQYGWSLDPALCYADNWTSLYQPQTFLGSLGRRIGADLAGLDDYTFIEPAFDTNYNVYYPPSSTEVPYWTGTFRESMVRDFLLYAEDVEANRYASYFQYDYGEIIIENLLTDNDLHIAILKDSFALPFTAFLSTAVGEIDMIDLRSYEGSVAEHLLETKPDLVIMMYANSTFKEAAMYEFFD